MLHGLPLRGPAHSMRVGIWLWCDGNYTVLTGRSVFNLSVSGRLPALSEGPGPLTKKQKQKFLHNT